MNLVLIGMRGSGKTTVAELLSKKLNRKFMETDKLLVKKAKITIPEIVSKYGWDHFRDLESEIIKDVCSHDKAVISTGGGVVVRQENINVLKKNSRIIYLSAKTETLWKRIGSDPNRPSLSGKQGKDDLQTVLNQRKKLYLKTADYVLRTDGKSVLQITLEVLEYLKKEDYD